MFILMDIFNFSYTCSQLNLPLCSIFDYPLSKYTSRSTTHSTFRISSITTILLILSSIICTLRIITNVRKQYTGIGRKEMIIFCNIYIAAISLDMFLISDILHTFISQEMIKVILATQLGFVNGCFFTILFGNLLSTSFFSTRFISNSMIVRIFSFLYCAASMALFLLFIKQKNGMAIFILLFAVNFCFSFFYYLIQLIKLKERKAEIWAFGTLTIALLFLLLAMIPMFFGTFYITILCEAYLDGLFFLHLFCFCTVVMLHKFWLSICDNEAECTSLLLE